MKVTIAATCFALIFHLSFSVRTKHDMSLNGDETEADMEVEIEEEERPRRKGSRSSRGGDASDISPYAKLIAGAPKWMKDMNHRRRISWYKSMATSCAEESSKCEDMVKGTLSSLDCTSAEDVDACMYEVLKPVADHGEKCCEAGTEYDDFVVKEVEAKDTYTFDKHTAVFVENMQRDFTTGSFAQPCWTSGGDSFINGVMAFMADAADKGATIIASKSFHPDDHCSFEGEAACKNSKDADGNSSQSSRYDTAFPAHTSFHGFEEEKSKKKHGKKDTNLYAKPSAMPDTPYCKMLAKKMYKSGFPLDHKCRDSAFIGTDFERAIDFGLKKIPPEQVDVVYKGFHKDFASFASAPHLVGVKEDCEDCKTFTGGYALKDRRARKCHGHWHAAHCHPTDKELADPASKMSSVMSILNKKKINKVYVIGFMFDYGVEETARFLIEAGKICANTPGLRSDSFLCDSGPFWNAGKKGTVTVVANLARPSFDGKPGAPYVESLCEGGDADGSFCTKGGGTTPSHESILAQLKEGGVKVVRQTPQKSHCA